MTVLVFNGFPDDWFGSGRIYWKVNDCDSKLVFNGNSVQYFTNENDSQWYNIEVNGDSISVTGNDMKFIYQDEYVILTQPHKEPVYFTSNEKSKAWNLVFDYWDDGGIGDVNHFECIVPGRYKHNMNYVKIYVKIKFKEGYHQQRWWSPRQKTH